MNRNQKIVQTNRRRAQIFHGDGQLIATEIRDGEKSLWENDNWPLSKVSGTRANFEASVRSKEKGN